MTLKSALIWRLKIASKITLAHLPVPYSFWKKIGIFEHGSMDSSEYVFKVFHRHFKNTTLQNRKDWVGLELGPGDSIASGIIAYAYGARKTYLVDAGKFASDDIEVYLKLIKFLRKKGLEIPEVNHDTSFTDLLKLYSIEYVTEGNKSLMQIGDQSIDFCWSQAVLEHVRLADFDILVTQVKRLMKPDGVNSHRVDLKDHLIASLNNLRFTQRRWESNLFSQSGFYTNRIRLNPMVSRFESQGFKVELQEVDRWENLPLAKSKMDPEFQQYSDDELKMSGFQFVAHL